MANYIRFDWAMKRMLRDKANFSILEGLITTLLERKVRIQKILESEGNQTDYDDKFNRVDILAEDDRGEIFIVEVQNSRELSYFHRMLYGVSKAVTDYMSLGQDFGKVRKVYSINIVYFSLGQGDDYVFHGYTTFRGIHEPHHELRLTATQSRRFFGDDATGGATPNAGALFPEYYVLRVEDFDKVATTPLDEWLRFLKSGEVADDANAPGLGEVRKRMVVDNMGPEDRSAYLKHVDNILYEHGAIESGRYEGRIEGIEEGRIEGRIEGRQLGRAEGAEDKAIEIAKRLLDAGMPAEQVASITNLDKERIEKLNLGGKA